MGVIAADKLQPIPLADAELFYLDCFDTDHHRHCRELIATVPWRRDRVRLFGREHPIPRLNAWYGDPGARYRYSGIELEPEPWLPRLRTWRDRLQDLTGAAFNSALLNYYRHGGDCMGLHADNEPELGPEPVIAMLSLGATRRFVLKHRQRKGEKRVFDLPGGSLLVMAGPCQRHWRHELPRTRKPVGERVSLTYRYVMPRE